MTDSEGQREDGDNRVVKSPHVYDRRRLDAKQALVLAMPLRARDFEVALSASLKASEYFLRRGIVVHP